MLAQKIHAPTSVSISFGVQCRIVRRIFIMIDADSRGAQNRPHSSVKQTNEIVSLLTTLIETRAANAHINVKQANLPHGRCPEKQHPRRSISKN